MCNIFRRSSQQIFELDRAKFLNDRRFLGDAVLETGLKFVEFAFLLVEVFDEAASSLLHLDEASLKTHPERGLVPLAVFNLVVGHWILRVPNVVSNELLYLGFPRGLQVVISYVLNFIH